MGQSWLSLCPNNPEVEIEQDNLISALRGEAFIGDDCNHSWSNLKWLLTGKHFFNHFLFQGTVITKDSATPPDLLGRGIREEKPVCVITITDHARISVVASTYSQSPHASCPQCHHEIIKTPATWEILNEWDSAPTDYRHTCPDCGYTGKLWEFDWGEHFAFCRYEIYVLDMYPDSFTVQPSLWEMLEQITQTQWRAVWGRI